MLYDKLYIRLCAVLQIIHNSTNIYIYIYKFIYLYLNIFIYLKNYIYFFASVEYWSQIIITSVYYSSLYFVNYYFCIINLYKISAKRFQSANTWIMPL